MKHKILYSVHPSSNVNQNERNFWDDVTLWSSVIIAVLKRNLQAEEPYYQHLLYVQSIPGWNEREISHSKSGCPPPLPPPHPPSTISSDENVHAYAWLASLYLGPPSRSEPRSFVLSPRVVSAVSPFPGSASRCSLAYSLELSLARKSTRDFHRWRARTRETVGTAIVYRSPIRGDPGEGKQVIPGQDRYYGLNTDR